MSNNNFNLRGISSMLNTTQPCVQSISQHQERVAGEGFIKHPQSGVIGFRMPLNVMDTVRTEKTDVLFRLVSFTISFGFCFTERAKTMSALIIFGSLHRVSVVLFF